MQLNRIELENYRGFDRFDLVPDNKSMVLYGINGSGKTSILRGISHLFSQIISKACNNQFRQPINFTREDVRFGTSTAIVSGLFTLDTGLERSYSICYRKDVGKKMIRHKESSEFMNAFDESYPTNMEAASTIHLPVFAYYGVNRAVLDVPSRIRTKHEFSPFETYQNAISPKTDFRLFFEWFRNQEAAENSKKVELQDFSYTDIALEATRRAIMSMLPELSNIRIMHKPIRMCATKNGQTLCIEQLSDGEKCVLALIGDLARRLAIANPGSENPLCGNGIVLIDEIELHMHPAWQQKIVAILRDAFPNIQFIITTHSPLVLGGLTDDFKVYGLYQASDNDNRILATEMPIGYYDANLVLEEQMQTPSISPQITALESMIFNNINHGNYEKAIQLVNNLRSMTNGTHPAITKAEILIRRKRGLQKS